MTNTYSVQTFLTTRLALSFHSNLVVFSAFVDILSPEQKQNVTMVAYITGSSHTNKLALKLTLSMIESQLFSTLRTKEQLGK
jgi:hypothetical protein